MINNLDDFTILRFAKIFQSGGGIETHLDDLDSILLRRNKVRIIRTYLETGSKDLISTKRKVGQGNLIEIPLHVTKRAIQPKSDNHKNKQSSILFLKELFRDLIFYNPFLYRAFFRDFLKRYYSRPGDLPIKNAGEKVRRILEEYNVDLLVMHHVGTVDSAEIMAEAKKLGIPYLFINHFSNDCFKNVSIREQLGDAAGIAGVTGVGIPKRIKNHFRNVSSGIDTEVFNPDLVQSIRSKINIPTIIYPARIIRNKGQIDLIDAYVRLRDEGLRVRIVFAGRIDSAEYEEELNGLVNKNGLTDDVHFLGELNREELRDWYGVSSVMAFPTYHQEGLPRILMEAQAMKVPPVAYIIGGTPEALQDGKTGFLVRKGDIKTFTRRLRELITNEERRRKMGEEGREFVKKQFSLEALAERHEQLYLSVLKR
ncbi:MAG TPA: glycosyltransferase family 1 protein [candidate division Zixibacteria bacterium]|nr:glycosyltransferase family 1 protein [candidate division Zixibacteria bacterium]